MQPTSNETLIPTGRSGTSDSTWRATFDHVPEWMPHSRTLAIVAVHPDNETLGAGGLIYTCADLGYEITIILVTDGEGARPEMPEVADCRIGELRAALTRLAPDGAHVVRLRVPEGEIVASEQSLAKRLLGVVPLDCTLLAPDEQEGLTEHAATSRACQTAARKLGVPCVRYPIAAWHRLASADVDAPPMGRVTLSDEARRAKRQAIECYPLQTEARRSAAILVGRPYEVFLL
jgi:LmbE family N-acetylglucosaminyl deacetylase